MLTTGVDIPDLEFIVFLRPVKSRILFEQMLGRGTRKGEKFPDKSHFTVFDCFDGTLLAYFRTRPASPPSRRTSRRARSRRSSRTSGQNRDRDYNIRCLVKRLQRIDKEMSGEARELFAAYIPDGDVGQLRRASCPARFASDFTGTMTAAARRGLPGPAGQLPAAASASSSWPSRPRTRSPPSGSSATPTARNTSPRTTCTPSPASSTRTRTQIEAIRILLDRPQDWSTDALTELRKKLTAHPSASRSRTFRRPTQLRYHKALVDIISMVKHAADEQEPLLHRRGAGRAGASRDVTAGHSIHRRAAAVARPHPRAPGREPLDRPGRLRHRARLLAITAAGAGRPSLRRADSPTCFNELNEAIAQHELTSSKNSGASATPSATTASTTATTSSRSPTCCSSRWPTSAASTLPKGCDWADAPRHEPAPTCTDHYIDILRKLGKQPGILGDIFAGAQSRFNNPVNLKRSSA